MNIPLILLALIPPLGIYFHARRQRIRAERSYEALVEYSKAASTLFHWRSANPRDFPHHPEARILIQRNLQTLKAYTSLLDPHSIAPEFTIVQENLENFLLPRAKIS